MGEVLLVSLLVGGAVVYLVLRLTRQPASGCGRGCGCGKKR